MRFIDYVKVNSNRGTNSVQLFKDNYTKPMNLASLRRAMGAVYADLDLPQRKLFHDELLLTCPPQLRKGIPESAFVIVLPKEKPKEENKEENKEVQDNMIETESKEIVKEFKDIVKSGDIPKKDIESIIDQIKSTGTANIDLLVEVAERIENALINHTKKMDVLDSKSNALANTINVNPPPPPPKPERLIQDKQEYESLFSNLK